MDWRGKRVQIFNGYQRGAGLTPSPAAPGCARKIVYGFGSQHSIDDLQERAFAFTDDNHIDLRNMFESCERQSRHMRSTDNNPCRRMDPAEKPHQHRHTASIGRQTRKTEKIHIHQSVYEFFNLRPGIIGQVKDGHAQAGSEQLRGQREQPVGSLSEVA